MNPKVHAVVETSDAVASGTGGAFKAAQAIAASEAFRKYSWIKNAPVMNTAGNFRGMVVNSHWATVFHFTHDVLKPVEKVAMVAALAATLVSSEGGNRPDPCVKRKLGA